MSGFAERFRTKGIVEIEAIQWTGDNPYVVREFTGMHAVEGGGNHMIFTTQDGSDQAELFVAANNSWLRITAGEWIIKDSLGFYPCNQDIFAAKYEGF